MTIQFCSFHFFNLQNDENLVNFDFELHFENENENENEGTSEVLNVKDVAESEKSARRQIVDRFCLNHQVFF